MIMAKLRHLALLTHQPEKLADFYKKFSSSRKCFALKMAQCTCPMAK
jgi:hypothetical protein